MHWNTHPIRGANPYLHLGLGGLYSTKTHGDKFEKSDLEFGLNTGRFNLREDLYPKYFDSTGAYHGGSSPHFKKLDFFKDTDGNWLNCDKQK